MSELKAIESATAVIENVHLVYRKSDVDAVIAELKSRESVLVTDNRNLLDKVKNLENHLRENAEHFKRNEAQILENADKVIAELKAQKAQSEDDCAYWKNMSQKNADDNVVMAKQRAEAFKQAGATRRYV